MNNHVRKIISVSIILMLTFAAVASGSAEKPYCTDQGMEGHDRGMRHECRGFMEGTEHMKGICGITLEKLILMDLSDAQKKDVANILAATRDANRQLTDQLIDAKKTFFETIHSPKAFDESAIRQSFRQKNTIAENLVVQKAKIMSELKPVLSEDQFKALMGDHSNKSDDKGPMRYMKKQRDVHRAMMDTWINTYADSLK